MSAELCLQANLAEQPSGAEQTFIALKREIERLAAEVLVVAV